MATVYWVGNATAVAQDTRAQVTGYDAATTYKITVGDVVISAPGTTNAAGTAAALVAAWNASTHPYCTGITASVATTDSVKLLADTAGVPFTVTSSVTGGTGTFAAFSATTASSGPNDWSTADNWSGGAVPVDNDTVILRDSSTNIVWGLDQNGIDLTELVIEQSYTGYLGLSRLAFATSADGATTVTTAVEYRDTYLRIKPVNTRIGEHTGPGSPAGSGRLKLDIETTDAGVVTVHNTASSGAETNLPPVRLLLADGDQDLHILGGSGGVGVAVDAPGETATLGDVYVSGSGSRLYLGDGVTVTNVTVQGGTATVRAAAGITSLTVDGGTVTTEGTAAITTCTVTGGTLYPQSTGTVTTLTQTGGTVDATRSSRARTVTTYNPDGGTLLADDGILTITTLDAPDGLKRVTVSAV